MAADAVPEILAAKLAAEEARDQAVASAIRFKEGYGRSGVLAAITDSARRKLLWFDKTGRLHLPSVFDVAGKITSLTEKLNSVSTRSGYLYVVRDSAQRALFGVDRAGEMVTKGVKARHALGQLPSPNIVTWTDSMGVIGNFPDKLAVMLGRKVTAKGVIAQNSSQIVARQGGGASFATPVGGVIPASGAVAVASRSVDIITENSPDQTMLISWAGVAGTLTRASDGAYTFTRTAPGDPVPVKVATPFQLNTYAHSRETVIFWMGRNNALNDLDTLYRDIALAVAHLKVVEKRFIILPVCPMDQASDWIGGGVYNALVAVRDYLRATYPQNFLDIWSLLRESYNPAIPQDVIDYDHGVLPSSLRSDPTHLNTSGGTVVARALADFIIQKGW